jgi:hypothetical protein
VDEWEGEFAPVPEAAPAGAWDVIEQNAMANVQMENRDMEYQMDELASYMAPQQAMSKGVLPVKLSVPKQGSLRRFVKLLVLDESASVEFLYKKPYKYRD